MSSFFYLIQLSNKEGTHDLFWRGTFFDGVTYEYKTTNDVARAIKLDDEKRARVIARDLVLTQRKSPEDIQIARVLRVDGDKHGAFSGEGSVVFAEGLAISQQPLIDACAEAGREAVIILDDSDYTRWKDMDSKNRRKWLDAAAVICTDQSERVADTVAGLLIRNSGEARVFFKVVRAMLKAFRWTA